MSAIPTPELIRRYQAGQTDLFDALFERYKDYAYRVAYSYAQNAAEAEDVVQEAFLDVLKALPRYDLEGPARFETWLYRVTANRCKMRFRRKRPASVDWDEVEFTIHDHSTPLPEQSAQQADTQRALWQAVGRLKDIYRDVILLRYGEDFSYDEIARALNVNLGTVKSRLNAAHKQLQSLISDDDDPDNRSTSWGSLVALLLIKAVGYVFCKALWGEKRPLCTANCFS